MVWTPSNSGRITDRWKLLWDLYMPLTVKCFGWLLLRKKVVVKDKIMGRALF